MEDLQLLVTHTRHQCDEVALPCCREDKRHARKGEPSCPGRDRRRASKLRGVRPVIWFRCERHAHEVDEADSTENEKTEWC